MTPEGGSLQEKVGGGHGEGLIVRGVKGGGESGVWFVLGHNSPCELCVFVCEMRYR